MDLISINQSITEKKFNYIEKLDAESIKAIDELGGSGNTYFMDEMWLSEQPSDLRKCWHILAQVDGINLALIENSHERKKHAIKEKYLKFFSKLLPFFLGGDLLKAKIQKDRTIIEYQNKLLMKAVKRKDNFLRLYEKYKTNDLQEHGLEANERSFHVKRCFLQGIAAWAQGPSVPITGQLYYWNMIDETLEESDYVLELKRYCFIDKDGMLLHRQHKRGDKKKFLEEMAKKYG